MAIIFSRMWWNEKRTVSQPINLCLRRVSKRTLLPNSDLRKSSTIYCWVQLDSEIITNLSVTRLRCVNGCRERSVPNPESRRRFTFPARAETETRTFRNRRSNWVRSIRSSKRRLILFITKECRSSEEEWSVNVFGPARLNIEHSLIEANSNCLNTWSRWQSTNRWIMNAVGVMRAADEISS